MTDVTLETTVRAAPRIASRVIDGRAVVIVIDEQKLHTLNDVGTFVFAQLDESDRTVGELIEATISEFDVERAVAQADVVAFLGQLAELGAVELSSGAGA